MKVSELIEKLKTLPQDAPVLCPFYEEACFLDLKDHDMAMSVFQIADDGAGEAYHLAEDIRHKPDRYVTKGDPIVCLALDYEQ